MSELGLRFIPMSYEEWLDLPEKPKVEFVDGVGIVSPPPAFDHGNGQLGLGIALRQGLPGLIIVVEVEFVLAARKRIRRPDISVVDHRPEGIWITDPPVLIVEVLSPGTRSQDTVNKAHEYAEAGVGNYWLLDPDGRCLDAYRNAGGGWDLVAHVDETSSVDVPVEGHGTVHVDLTDILGSAAT